MNKIDIEDLQRRVNEYFQSGQRREPAGRIILDLMRALRAERELLALFHGLWPGKDAFKDALRQIVEPGMIVDDDPDDPCRVIVLIPIKLCDP